MKKKRSAEETLPLKKILAEKAAENEAMRDIPSKKR